MNKHDYFYDRKEKSFDWEASDDPEMAALEEKLSPPKPKQGPGVITVEGPTSSVSGRSLWKVGSNS